jgi:hypothetical protein
MVGRDVSLPEGYSGYVMGKLNQQMGFISFDGSGTEKIEFEAIAKFGGVTEWKKDAWNKDERGHVTNLIDYLECAKIMHSEE